MNDDIKNIQSKLLNALEIDIYKFYQGNYDYLLDENI